MQRVKSIAISQSNYIPWKGYFDLIAFVDEFVLFDDMQYTRRDWRNRNKIKTPQGLQWLTVPVQAKGKYHQAIRETALDGDEWAVAHWKAITLNYRKAPFFNAVAAMLEPLYLEETHATLSTLNRRFIEVICDYLGISTLITNSWNYDLLDGKSERLAGICEQAGAGVYVSGPAAREYLNIDCFSQLGIEVEWYDYDGYREYHQLWGEFEHGVSILDVLFNCGPDANHCLRHAA